MRLAGVLLLTAGYGTRVEPLSLARPKCLLPWADSTVLGILAEQVSALDPVRVRINASRCPDEILTHLYEVWPKERCRLYFEERPLGGTATLARHSEEMASGSWMVVNTDMVMPGLDMRRMFEEHVGTGAAWTALTGALPEDGGYTPLAVDDKGRFGVGGTRRTHYRGVSIMEPGIPELAASLQAHRGMFSELAPMASEECGELMVHSSSVPWLDMGRLDTLRENILRGGSFVHPSACVSSDAVLLGRYSIGRGCMLGSGTLLRDSVMLEGSTLEEGKLEEGLLPWSCSSTDGERI